jgi:hypothetical protein
MKEELTPEGDIQNDTEKNLQELEQSNVLKDIFNQIETDKEQILSTINNNPASIDEEELKNLSFQKDVTSSQEDNEVLVNEENPEEETIDEDFQKEQSKTAKPKLKDWQLKRMAFDLAKDKKFLEEQLYQAKDTIAKLSQSEQQLVDDNIFHFENKARSDLEIAEAALENAKDAYDTKAEIKAQKMLYDAHNRVQEVEKYRAREQQRAAQIATEQKYLQDQFLGYPPPRYEQQYQAPLPQQPYQQLAVDPAVMAQDLISSWIGSHDAINPNSRYYKPEIWEKVQSYAEKYEKSLHANGRGNEILSEAYFNKLDGYVDSLAETVNQTAVKSSLPSAHIGSVRSNSSPMTSNKKQVSFSAEEENAIEHAASLLGKVTAKEKEEFRKAWISNLSK